MVNDWHILCVTAGMGRVGSQQRGVPRSDLDRDRSKRALLVFLACGLLWAIIVYLCLRVL